MAMKEGKVEMGEIRGVQELSWKILKRNCHGYLRYQRSLAWRPELASGYASAVCDHRRCFLARAKKLPLSCFLRSCPTVL